MSAGELEIGSFSLSAGLQRMDGSVRSYEGRRWDSLWYYGYRPPYGVLQQKEDGHPRDGELYIVSCPPSRPRLPVYA